MKKRFNTLGDFVSEIERIISKKEGDYFFRGEANKTWKTIPHVLREEKLKLEENSYITQVMNHLPDSFTNHHDMFGKLVEMQHFGIPTRLLDITRSPLIALYFCVNSEPDEDGKILIYPPMEDEQKLLKINNNDSREVVIRANISLLTLEEKENLREKVIFLQKSILPIRKEIKKLSKVIDEIISTKGEHELDSKIDALEEEREKYYNEEDIIISEFNDNYAARKLIYLVKREIPLFQRINHPYNLNKCRIVIPKLTNNRIISQQGAFLIYGLKETYDIKNKETIIINKDDKENLRKSLEDFGISTKTIFPDLEGFGRYIKSTCKN